MCLQIFLEGSNWAGWTDRQQEVVPKRRGTRVKSSSTSIGLDPREWQTIIIVWSQWTGRNRCSKHGVKINRLFFTQGFAGQQIDLKKYSKPYWQPMKRTKQWNTACKWGIACSKIMLLVSSSSLCAICSQQVGCHGSPSFSILCHSDTAACIERENQRTQNGPPRDSKFEIGLAGQTVTYLNLLASTSQIRFKPVECLPSSPKSIIKSTQ